MQMRNVQCYAHPDLEQKQMLNVTYTAAQCTHADPEQTQMLNVMHITAHTDLEQTEIFL